MLPEPKLNVRFFEGSPPELLELACRLTCKGLSNPAYFNDRVAIPGLLRLGIPIEDARDYCNDGCSELIIGGKSTIGFENFDALPLLQETVLKGQEKGFATFDDVVSDFRSRLENRPRRLKGGKALPTKGLRERDLTPEDLSGAGGGVPRGEGRTSIRPSPCGIDLSGARPLSEPGSGSPAEAGRPSRRSSSPTRPGRTLRA